MLHVRQDFKKLKSIHLVSITKRKNNGLFLVKQYSINTGTIRETAKTMSAGMELNYNVDEQT